MKSVFSYFLCFLAGLCLVLAFAPFGHAWVAFISLSVLFYNWYLASAKQAFLQGLCFGFGLFIGGTSWVYNSLSTFGGMPLWMGLLSVLLFALFMALFIAFAGWCTARLSLPKSNARLCLLPFIWVIFEWLKSWFLTGFPWLDVGYSQSQTWLFSYAPVGGVYFISFLLALIATCLIAILVKQQRIIRLISLGLIAVVFLSGKLLENIQWTKNSQEQPLKVALVQANIPIASKWQAASRDKIIQTFASQSQQIQQSTPVDLIVWPETALPIYLQQTDERFWQSIVPGNTTLLTGLIDEPDKTHIYNAAILRCDGQTQIYRKRHLVPFGEYLPLRFLFNWVLDYLQLPMSDFNSWQGQQPLNCGDKINLSLSICYEDAFASEWRAHLGDATVLVNISEDAWFGDSLAPSQRLQMAQMRAREFSRPLVRSSNTGPSVLINQKGKIAARTQTFVAENLIVSLEPKKGKTLFMRLGNWIIILALIVVLITGFQRMKKK